jgi:KDO2-lipid IV(A) lauroyltransferase
MPGRRAVAATFDSYGRYFYELFRLPGTPQASIDDHTHVSGAEHLATAIDAGRGLVLALPHLGNWDAAGAWLAGQGYTVTVVAEPLEPPELFDWFVDTRRQLGMRVIPLSPTAGAEVLRALRANHVVCLLCDRDLTGDGIEVEFLGERTTLPQDGNTAPQRRASRHGRVLLRPHGSHESASDPIDTERKGRIRDDVNVTQTSPVASSSSSAPSRSTGI